MKCLNIQHGIAKQCIKVIKIDLGQIVHNSLKENSHKIISLTTDGAKYM